MVYERCVKGKCCGCALGVTFKLRIYTWLFSRVLYVLSFIPGKVGYSLLQKSHLPNVPEWFSHLFVCESWGMGVRALVPPSWGDVTTCIISIRSKKKKKERERDLYFVQYFSSPHSWNSIQNWQCSPALRLLVYCAWLIHKVVHLLQEPANNALLCFAAFFLYRQRVNRHKNTWSTFLPIIGYRWKTFCNRNVQ